MHGLGVLPQIIQPGEASRAMALEGAFASMFPTSTAIVSATASLRQYASKKRCEIPDMAGEMFAPGEAEVAWRIIGAIKPLRLFLF